MTTSGNEPRLGFKSSWLWLLLMFSLIHSIHTAKAATMMHSQSENNFEACNAELEKKFITDNVRCPQSGLFPVKGSCTAYIPCVSFGGDLMKPLKRAECSFGLTFDITYLRCRPAQKLEGCLQRLCYPTETLLEDAESSSPPTASDEEESKKKLHSITNANPSDDVDEISACNESFGGIHRDNSFAINTSAVADRGNLKFMCLHFLVLLLVCIYSERFY